jgi:branched-chain amino acid transport system substrate-binding protein
MFEGVNKGQNDFSALITKMKIDGVDFVYYGGYHPELGLILRQSREQGFNARFMGPEGVGNKDISAIAGPASEGLLVTLPADFSSDPANADLVKAFKEKGEDPSGPFVMPSYSAVKIIADTIAATQSTDPIEIAEAMHATTYETPIGTVAFDEKGDLKEFDFVIYEWHADATKTAVNE